MKGGGKGSALKGNFPTSVKKPGKAKGVDGLKGIGTVQSFKEFPGFMITTHEKMGAVVQGCWKRRIFGGINPAAKKSAGF
jgi:hypothetical protein